MRRETSDAIARAVAMTSTKLAQLALAECVHDKLISADDFSMDQALLLDTLRTISKEDDRLMVCAFVVGASARKV